MPKWLSEIGRQAPQAALAWLAAKQGGPEAFAAFQSGMYEAQQQRAALARQAQMDEERRTATEEERAYRQRQEQRQVAGDERTEADRAMQRKLEALQALNRFVTQVPDTYADPLQAEQDYTRQAGQMESLLGMRPGDLSTTMPSGGFSMAISRRMAPKIRTAASAALTAAQEKYGPDANIRVQDGTLRELLGDRYNPQGYTVPELEALAEVQATDPTTGARVAPVIQSGGAPNTPEEQQIADAIATAEEAKGSPLTRAERSAVRVRAISEIDAARRDPRAPARDTSAADDMRRFNMEQRLVTQWDNANKPFKEMQRQLQLMSTGLSRFRAGDKNGGAQAVLVTFQKILDPTSVVRESEYARTAAGQSLMNRIAGYTQRLESGGAGLTDAEMALMVGTAQEFMDGMATFNSGLRSRINRTASEYRLDPRMIFDDVLAPAAAPSAAPGRIYYDADGNPRR